MRVEIRFELGTSVELALFDKFVAAVERVRSQRQDEETVTAGEYVPQPNAVVEGAPYEATIAADSITEASVSTFLPGGEVVPTTPTYTNNVDDIKLATLVRAHAATFGAAATVQVLGTFGAKRVSDVAADKRGDLANALAYVKGIPVSAT